MDNSILLYAKSHVIQNCPLEKTFDTELSAIELSDRNKNTSSNISLPNTIGEYPYFI